MLNLTLTYLPIVLKNRQVGRVLSGQTDVCPIFCAHPQKQPSGFTRTCCIRASRVYLHPLSGGDMATRRQICASSTGTIACCQESSELGRREISDDKYGDR